MNLNEVSQNEEVMRRILNNQKLIIEQNTKIIQQQESQIAADRAQESRRATNRDKVPSTLKVNLIYAQGKDYRKNVASTVLSERKHCQSL